MMSLNGSRKAPKPKFSQLNVGDVFHKGDLELKVVSKPLFMEYNSTYMLHFEYTVGGKKSIGALMWRKKEDKDRIGQYTL